MESKRAKCIEAENRWVVARGWSGGNGEMLVKVYILPGIRGLNSGHLMHSKVTDCRQQYCIVYLKFAIRVDLECSHHKNNKILFM